jgi:hypothetical protein
MVLASSAVGQEQNKESTKAASEGGLSSGGVRGQGGVQIQFFNTTTVPRSRFFFLLSRSWQAQEGNQLSIGKRRH